jgi:hypothetical protein
VHQARATGAFTAEIKSARRSHRPAVDLSIQGAADVLRPGVDGLLG